MPAKDRLQQHYDLKYATERDALTEKTAATTQYPRDRFEAFMKFFPPLFKGGDILELAAGSGIIARSILRSNVSIASYTLTEYSQARLAGLTAISADPRIRLQELNAEEIDREGCPRYDAVIMIALIEHLIDPLGAMQRIREILKPGGFVYIDTPNIAKYTRRLKLLLGRFPSTASKNEGLTTYEGDPTGLYDAGHLHYFTFRSLSLMLTERCGFSGVEKLGYACGHKLLGPVIDNWLAAMWPSLFSEIALVAYV